MENINIFFLNTNSYTEHLCTTIISILENNRNSNFNFYILTFDMNKKNKTILNSLSNQYKNFKIKYIKVNQKLFKGLKISIKHVPLITYSRYMIPNIDKDIDKCLFLDCDLVVNNDISKLYNIDLTNCYAAAAKDMFAYKINTEHRKNIGLADNDLYFNAGVVLYNLKEMRKDNITEKLFKNTKKYAKKIKFQDQDILNITLKDKVKEIDTIYNYGTLAYQFEPEKKERAVVIHWNQCKKPWNNAGRNYFSDLYFKYKDLSPFASKIKIFSIYHKNSPLFQSDVITPIQTGNEILPFNLLKDNTCDNIAEKNEYYAELTANYWVWKNYLQNNKNIEYIGFCHYRRFINFENNGDKYHHAFSCAYSFEKFYNTFSIKYKSDRIYPIIKDYDIVLPSKYIWKKQNVYQQYCQCHPKEEIDKLINIIKTKYPDMVQDMNEYLYGNKSYYCLNYVMKQKLFDNFMNWTFDLLNEMEKQTNWNKYKDYKDKKIPAYLIERFFNVWLKYHIRTENIKIIDKEGIFLTDKSNKMFDYIPAIKTIKRIINKIERKLCNFKK